MIKVVAHITVHCPDDKQHLDVSSLLKTVLHTLDQAIETNGSGNDFKYEVEGAHPDAKTQYTGVRNEHPLRKAFGL